VVSSNGASVFDRSAQQPVVRRMTMPACRAVDIYTLLDRYELSFELYHSGKAYLERNRLQKFRQSFSADFAAHLLARTCLVDSLVPLFQDGSIEKFNVSGVSAGDRVEIAGFLSRFDDLTLTSSLEGNLEVTAAGVSKANALAWLADALGVTSGDVVAFGDSGNDVGMLRWAGMSYAMGNGTEEVKAAARWVTGSNANDGVATALRSLMSRGEPRSVPRGQPHPQRPDVPSTWEPAR
jgi:hypothetical protein